MNAAAEMQRQLPDTPASPTATDQPRDLLTRARMAEEIERVMLKALGRYFTGFGTLPPDDE